jgi:MFS transporter, putative metabolite:H+ symporter
MSILTTTDTTVLSARAATLQNAASISARLDRLPATWSVWKLVIMLSLGSFFELYDLVLTGYVTPGLMKSGVLSGGAASLSNTTDIWSFFTLLFSGRASFIARSSLVYS